MKGFDDNAQAMAILAYRLEKLSRDAHEQALQFEADPTYSSDRLRIIVDTLDSVSAEIKLTYF